MRPAKLQRKRRQALRKQANSAIANADTCACGKRAYRNEGDAQSAILTGHTGIRVYLGDCGSWHTTSQRRKGRGTDR